MIVLSDYSWEMAKTESKQESEQDLDQYYFDSFGDLREEGKPFALRLVEYHVTLRIVASHLSHEIS